MGEPWEAPTVLDQYIEHLNLEVDAAEARVKILEEALNMKPGWSLSWGPLDEDDEASEYAWMVDAVRGGVNDREWRMIGSGPTPLDALIAAHATEAARRAALAKEEGGR